MMFFRDVFDRCAQSLGGSSSGSVPQSGWNDAASDCRLMKELRRGDATAPQSPGEVGSPGRHGSLHRFGRNQG